MDGDELEEELAKAHVRLELALKALAPKHQGGEMEEYRAAHTQVIALERELAKTKGEQYADSSDFPVQWDAGAPLPHVISNDHKTFLIFYVREDDLHWDGTYVTVNNPADALVESLALVEFVGCDSFKMGSPNDEVFSGHPLFGKGLEGYTAQIVRNSQWLAELEAINKVHTQYRPEPWQQLTHYVFWFHDSTFECVAKSYQVELFRTTVSSLLAEVCKRLLSHSPSCSSS